MFLWPNSLDEQRWFNQVIYHAIRFTSCIRYFGATSSLQGPCFDGGAQIKCRLKSMPWLCKRIHANFTTFNSGIREHMDRSKKYLHVCAHSPKRTLHCYQFQLLLTRCKHSEIVELMFEFILILFPNLYPILHKVKPCYKVKGAVYLLVLYKGYVRHEKTEKDNRHGHCMSGLRVV